MVIEAIRNRFHRTNTSSAEQTYSGKMDLHEIVLRSLTKDAIVMDEATEEGRKANEYLRSLEKVDRRHVGQFLEFVQELNNSLGDKPFAILAVGSTTVPSDKRFYPPNDIDLRILSAQKKKSQARKGDISYVADRIYAYFSETSNSVTRNSQTATSRPLPAGDIYTPWVDYPDNNHPSIKVRFSEGLPLHISIAGVDSIAKDDYLKQETKHKTSAVVLLK